LWSAVAFARWCDTRPQAVGNDYTGARETPRAGL